MIIVDVSLVCDVCGDEVKTTMENGKLMIPNHPKQWVVQKWIPGVLKPERKPDKHICSEKCKKELEEQNAEESRRST